MVEVACCLQMNMVWGVIEVNQTFFSHFVWSAV